MGTTTTTPAAVEPEVADATRQLAAIPTDWTAGALADAVMARANARVSSRKIDDRLVAAQRAAEAALAAVAAGDTSEAALDAVAATHTQLAAFTTAKQRMPLPALDPAVLQAAFDKANAALSAGAPEPTKPAYVQEMDAWRTFSNTTRRVVDPPVATDADRAVAANFQTVYDGVAEWRQGVNGWRQTLTRPGAADPLEMLAAAAGYVAMASSLTSVVDQTNAATAVADKDRRDRGLTWKLPGL